MRKYIRGGRSVEIAEGIEAAIAAGALAPGDRLPTVRELAAALAVSPTTVNAATRALRARGLLVARGRRGTQVAARPALRTALPAPQRRGVRDLSTGNPDPALLPPLRPALDAIDDSQHLYGGALEDPALLALARRDFTRDSVPSDALTVTSGAMDAIERVLQSELRPGDPVAVEDPGFTGVLDLLPALGLAPVPVAIDERGALPDALGAALAGGARAFLTTPRAQNPLGACFDPPRARALGRVLRSFPGTLLVEDDHAGRAAGAPYLSLCHSVERWAVVRSLSKVLGPDLRVALVAGDASTLARIAGRQLLGVRWVSHILQRCAAALWGARGFATHLREAERCYRRRREALITALAAREIPAFGRSGFNVWIPVPEEARAAQGLLDAGFAVAAGERFRLQSGPALRVTISTLQPEEAETLAGALADLLGPAQRRAAAS